jgi:hypothetical protein
MEWVILAAPVPASLDFGVAGIVALVAGLVAALVPVALAARHALGHAATEPERSPLRVLTGGKEPARRAA